MIPTTILQRLYSNGCILSPQLQSIKAALRGGGFDVVLLSGSGATTFALDKVPNIYIYIYIISTTWCAAR